MFNRMHLIGLLVFIATFIAAGSNVTAQPLVCAGPFKELARLRASELARIYVVVEWPNTISYDQFVKFASSCHAGSFLGYPHNAQSKAEFNRLRASNLAPFLLDAWVGGYLKDPYADKVSRGFVCDDGPRTPISTPGAWCANKSCFAAGEPDGGYGDPQFLGYSKNVAGLYADKDYKVTLKRGVVEIRTTAP